MSFDGYEIFNGFILKMLGNEQEIDQQEQSRESEQKTTETFQSQTMMGILNEQK